MDPSWWGEQEPLVVIGMHRSGTSLLARLLAQCGVFMGADVQGNHESQTFLKINDALFWQCGATWNQPFGIHVALQDRKRVRALAYLARQRLQERFASYWGGSETEGLARVWGWKDPRTTFTLPIWRAIFPKLRVLHLLRHGVDCAQSLYRRDWHAYHAESRPYLPALMVGRDAMGLHHARRGWTLEESFAIWEEYVEKAREQLPLHGSRALEIRYEDMLQHPRIVWEAVFAFCGITPPPSWEDRMADVDASRAFAHRQQPELASLARRWQRTLARFGYDGVTVAGPGSEGPRSE